MPLQPHLLLKTQRLLLLRLYLFQQINILLKLNKFTLFLLLIRSTKNRSEARNQYKHTRNRNIYFEEQTLTYFCCSRFKNNRIITALTWKNSTKQPITCKNRESWSCQKRILFIKIEQLDSKHRQNKYWWYNILIVFTFSLTIWITKNISIYVESNSNDIVDEGKDNQ